MSTWNIKKEVTPDCRLSCTIRGHFSEFLVSNIMITSLSSY